MWECPSVAFVDLFIYLFIGRRTVLGFDACRLFPQHILAVFPLIGSVVGIGGCKACVGYEVGFPLCSVAVTILSGAGPAPQVMG